MRDEPIELDEAPLVEQQVEPLAGRELPLGVLGLKPLGPAAELRLGTTPVEQIEFLAHH